MIFPLIDHVFKLKKTNFLKNNSRLFNDESINWLIGVKHLKQFGMTVEDIKTYVDLNVLGHYKKKPSY
ncbi:MerR family transcriptional regulator [Niallia oryzisoli]|uniref:MerR family transcriptional regulator n=1 Tax=Niallia oryzisoli TaxID=1737571 RepID=A0ABZ2CMK9_9BACI